MSNASLSYLFFTFLRIGATSWGGFMALISLVEKKIVEKDQKLDSTTMTESISLASLLPGPMAVNVVALIGFHLRGWAGALVSVVGVLLPSFGLILGLSVLYFSYGTLPEFAGFLKGILPAVAAVIAGAALSLGKKNIRNSIQVLLAVTAGVVVFFSKSYWVTLVLLLASGLIGYLTQPEAAATSKTDLPPIRAKKRNQSLGAVFGLVLLPGFFLLWLSTNAVCFDIFTTFSSISLTQFGGGYVIIPSMQKVLVDGLQWISQRTFADTIAMGQITPGPIFISAAAIGFKMAGFGGALVATIAMFGPPALVAVLVGRYAGNREQSVSIKAAFKGINPAVTGMITSAALSILLTDGLSFPSLVLFGLSWWAINRLKIDPAYLLPLAGVIGWIVF